MPIGKDSITKRVAKVETTTAPVEKVDVSPTPKKKTSTTAATTKKAAPKTAAKKPATTVIANIAPETVNKVACDNFKKTQIGSELPYYLL